jgi:hypothetical protein
MRFQRKKNLSGAESFIRGSDHGRTLPKNKADATLPAQNNLPVPVLRESAPERVAELVAKPEVGTSFAQAKRGSNPEAVGEARESTANNLAVLWEPHSRGGQKISPRITK